MHHPLHRPIRIVFFGTSDFAIPTLERLAIDQRFHVVAVVTQPDRPVGRYSLIQAPPMKVAAQRLALSVLQEENIKSEDAVARLRSFQADLAVVASFGQILSQATLDLYPFGVINVHPSLLPKYRGPTPFLDPIIHGDTETGVSILKMDAEMDHGPLLAQITESIRPDDTGASLGERLWRLGANILPQTLVDFVDGKIVLQEQDHTHATKTRLLTRNDGRIDWTQPAETIERLVRAYTPWPGTYTTMDRKRLKIGRVSIGPSCDLPAGKTFIEQQSLLPAVCCGTKTSLLLLRVQPEGKMWMDGEIFLRGCHGWEQLMCE